MQMKTHRRTKNGDERTEKPANEAGKKEVKWEGSGNWNGWKMEVCRKEERY